MANDIYSITHSGLTELVSARVATLILDKALRTRGLAADAVSRAEMKGLLIGPVTDELEGILPPSGVARNLKQIYAALPKEVEVPPPADILDDGDSSIEVAPAVTETPEMPGGLEVTAAELTAARPAVVTLEPDVVGSAMSLELADTLPPASSSAIADSVTAVRPPLRTLYVDEEPELERIMLEFARLDHVRMVAGLTLQGDVVMSRGEGLDIAAIARFGAVGLKLLGRNGSIRSYYLAHSALQLFLFPLGTYAVMVIGTVDLNLGAVFSTLSTLEEDV